MNTREATEVKYRRPGINVGDVVRFRAGKHDYAREYGAVHNFDPEETFEVTFRQQLTLPGPGPYALHLKGKVTGAVVLAKPSHLRVVQLAPGLLKRQ